MEAVTATPSGDRTLCDQDPAAFCQIAQGKGVNIGRQHEKFFAAPAAHHIDAAESMNQGVGHGFQNRVSYFVAMGVVHALETVHIQ